MPNGTKINKNKGGGMKLRIYTDLHLFSPMDSTIPINKVDESIFIGDVVDFANCKKSDHDRAMRIYYHLRENALLWIDGNHSRMSINNDIIKIGEVMLVHGDTEAWGEKRAIKYRSKPHCAGWFKRNLWVRALKNFEKIGKNKPSKKMIKNLVAHAKFRNCNTIICGHTHPRDTYDRINNGVRVIVLKRGLTEIEV